MVMDQPSSGFCSSINGLEPRDCASSGLTDYTIDVNGFNASLRLDDQNHANTFQLPPTPGTTSKIVLSSATNQAEDSHEDYDFSDVVLKYISQMLMEEDIEEKACMYQESAALLAKEQSFYDLIVEKIGEKLPSSSHKSVSSPDGSHINPGESSHFKCSNYSSSSSSSSSADPVDLCWHSGFSEQKSPKVASHSSSQSSYSSSSGNTNSLDGLVDSPVSTLIVTDIFNDIESVMQFRRGFEEASKFIPSGNKLTLDLERNWLLPKEMRKEIKDIVVTVEKKHNNDDLHDGSRGRKNPHIDDVDTEQGRSNKQSAISNESSVSSEMFDMILLNCEPAQSALHEALQNGRSKNVQQNGQSKGSNGGKARRKRQGGKKEVVDLRTLLTLCAQSVATDDRRNANEFLKQIRQHSSPMGDGMQRMAYYFADGLEARMAGSGTEIYNALINKRTPAADVLKAYHLFMAACPFRKLSNFFSNKTIMNLAEKAPTLHIIDFGILYGFQWPCLIQRLSTMPGGPPKLRITGIDFPQPGFRPLERVEETGRRLANYAKTFGVQFEFNAIAQKWDTIQIESLKLDSNEVVVVNCLFRLRNLLDETVIVDSPRDIVLNLIRRMNPHVFIFGIVNGAYNAPFFITRFREALFHYSTLFDMLETNVPREIPERTLIEKEIFGYEAMNVIACEGFERIERPEAYKQWQVRNLRAGFRQLPLNQEIMQVAREKTKSLYHKDFVIDEDGKWLLQGWKGRIVYALSCWGPAY